MQLTGQRTLPVDRATAWAALNDVELLTFFTDVCGEFPDARFLHYNLPRARRVLNGADYRRLADAVPNLAATKNTGGGAQRAADLMRNAPDLQHFFGEDNFLAGCQFGECSLLASFGPLAPRKTWEYFEAGRAGQLDTLVRLHHGFLELLSDLFGELLKQERIDGAYDKLIVRLAGLAPGAYTVKIEARDMVTLGLIKQEAAFVVAP